MEEGDGHPSVVRTGDKGGILRIDFGQPEDALEPIEWDELLIFDENDLAFLHQDEAGGGGKSRFKKFVERRRTTN